jgi:hypothetical protein
MLEAGIHIDCYADAGRPPQIDIRRPVHASRLFEGRTPAEVIALAPTLFSVCSVAQGVAASHALAAAAGDQPDAEMLGVHGALVRLELAREHLWRVLADWPGFVGQAPDPAALRRAQAIMPAALEALTGTRRFQPVSSPLPARDGAALSTVIDEMDSLFAGPVLGAPADAWLGLSNVPDLEALVQEHDGLVPQLVREIFARNWQAACGFAPDFLHALGTTEVEAALANGNASRFVETPTVDGDARETSPLGRRQADPLVADVVTRFGFGLLARVVATVNELATTRPEVEEILAGARDSGISAATTGPSAGAAIVDAARGLLVHRAVVHGPTVESYRIVAPTEWNFHPAGSARRGLEALAASGSTDAAELFIALIDPCVAYSLEFH